MRESSTCVSHLYNINDTWEVLIYSSSPMTCTAHLVLFHSERTPRYWMSYPTEDDITSMVSIPWGCFLEQVHPPFPFAMHPISTFAATLPALHKQTEANQGIQWCALYFAVLNLPRSGSDLATTSLFHYVWLWILTRQQMTFLCVGLHSWGARATLQCS